MIEKLLISNTIEGFRKLFGTELSEEMVTLQKTRSDFEGDFTIVVFPLLKYSGKNPEQTAIALGQYLETSLEEVRSFNVIKGFLNIVLHDSFWMDYLTDNYSRENYGLGKKRNGDPVVVEFSSPNTNKPLHLGHIRNNLIGWSISRILEANGYDVEKVNLVNDRGIHICKTMVAWQKWGQGTVPDVSGTKGDKLVGELYVKFETENNEQVNRLIEKGMTGDEALKNTSLIMEANEMLRKWEAGEPSTRQLWAKMNAWVYKGFELTYERMGVSFDKMYYESDTYKEGKKLVQEGLEKGVCYRKEDNSVWVGLTNEGLDEKLLLRGDGTSVYITQDLGTAQLRYDEYHPDRLLYVVGNEQNYHFEVLKLILKKLGRAWSDNIIHINYGMVELPHGRMKSREGTVVDADELMEEMHRAAEKMTTDLGKLEGFREQEAMELYEMVGIGALKYFILKVDPKKNMLFNPEESIDFNGNTGPFIQYTYARVQSLLRKAKQKDFDADLNKAPRKEASFKLLDKEKGILRLLHEFPGIVREAGEHYSPALMANYAYELAREYNQFYQEVPILREEDENRVYFRLGLSDFAGRIIKTSMSLLGISVPDKM